LKEISQDQENIFPLPEDVLKVTWNIIAPASLSGGHEKSRKNRFEILKPIK
jgi:hypothetical protein